MRAVVEQSLIWGCNAEEQGGEAGDLDAEGGKEATEDLDPPTDT